jgi:hypothetical protein
MFVINKAQFTTDPVTVNFKIKSNTRPYYVDEIIVNSDDISFPTTQLTYGLKTTYLDTITNPSIPNFVYDDTPIIVNPKQTLDFGQDLKSSSISTSRRKFVLPGNSSSMQLEVTMQTADPDITPIFNAERLNAIINGNVINPGSISISDVSIIDSTNITGIDPSTIQVIIDPPQLATGIQATANITAGQITSGLITGVNIINPGAGYIQTPNIAILSASNVVLANAAIRGEDSKYGGNALCRYITRKIILADGFDAGDLRVWVDGIIPSGTSVEVYYKVQSVLDTDDFINKSWQLMSVLNNYNSPDQLTPIELTFAPSIVNGAPSGYLSYTEDGVSYPLGGKFKYFAIKIILLANDPAVYPKLTNLRVIALPSG